MDSTLGYPGYQSLESKFTFFGSGTQAKGEIFGEAIRILRTQQGASHGPGDVSSCLKRKLQNGYDSSVQRRKIGLEEE